VQEVAISATVYTPNDDNVETFGQVENAKITVIDEESGDALCCHELSSDYQTEDACVAARFVINDDGEWAFEAMGNGYNGGLQTLVDMYTEE
jgi:stress response protein SCP2